MRRIPNATGPDDGPMGERAATAVGAEAFGTNMHVPDGGGSGGLLATGDNNDIASAPTVSHREDRDTSSSSSSTGAASTSTASRFEFVMQIDDAEDADAGLGLLTGADPAVDALITTAPAPPRSAHITSHGTTFVMQRMYSLPVNPTTGAPGAGLLLLHEKICRQKKIVSSLAQRFARTSLGRRLFFLPTNFFVQQNETCADPTSQKNYIVVEENSPVQTIVLETSPHGHVKPPPDVKRLAQFPLLGARQARRLPTRRQV